MYDIYDIKILAAGKSQSKNFREWEQRKVAAIVALQ